MACRNNRKQQRVRNRHSFKFGIRTLGSLESKSDFLKWIHRLSRSALYRNTFRREFSDEWRKWIGSRDSSFDSQRFLTMLRQMQNSLTSCGTGSPSEKRVFRWHPEHLNRLRTNTRSFETAFGYFRILPQLVPPILQPKPLPSLIPKFILRYPALPIVFWPPLPLVRPNCRAGKESDIFKYMGRTMIAGRLASNPFPTNYPRVLSFHRKPCQQQRKSIIYRFWVMDRDAFFWSDRPQPTINKMS